MTIIDSGLFFGPHYIWVSKSVSQSVSKQVSKLVSK